MDPSVHSAFCSLARKTESTTHTHTRTRAVPCRAVLSVDYGWFDRGQAGRLRESLRGVCVCVVPPLSRWTVGMLRSADMHRGSEAPHHTTPH